MKDADRSRSKSIDSIQFMRFVAATSVVFFHATVSFQLYFGDVSSRFLDISFTGAAGVHIFFVISGFIMVYTSFSNQQKQFSAERFFFRRFIRIYPIYWIYCLIYLVFHQIVGSKYNLSIHDVIFALLLFPWYSGAIIGPGWTLAFEVYFYLCFGLAMSLGLSYGFIALTAFFGMSIAAGIVFHVDSSLFKFMTNGLLIEFLMGAGIGYLFLRDIKIPPAISFAMQAAALLGFALDYVIGHGKTPTPIIWGISSAFLIAGLAFNEKRGVTWSIVQRAAFLGDSSYSLYLIHILLIDVAMSVMSVANAYAPILGESPLAVCIVTTFLCIICGIACYENVERKLVVSLQAAGRRVPV